MKFKEWFSQRLIVGAFPITQNTLFDGRSYDVVVNVSDEFYPEIEKKLHDMKIRTYWFPMNECKRDIGLNSIYGAMVTLYHAELAKEFVYLHCHAGANRSPTVQAAYHFMRTGTQLDQPRGGGYINRLLAACGRGYLPPKAETEQYLTYIGNSLKANNMQGGLLDWCKLEAINNF